MCVGEESGSELGEVTWEGENDDRVEVFVLDVHPYLC